MTPAWDEIADMFGLGALQGTPVPVDGGLTHQVWRVETPTGTFAVKELRNRWGWKDFLPALQRAAEFELEVWRSGIRIPRPVLPPGTQEAIVDLGDDRWVRVHEWVDANPVPPGPVAPTVARQVGAALAAIHRLGGTLADPRSGIPWYEPGTDWQGLANRFAPLRPALSAIDEALTFLRTWGEPSGVAVMTHTDVDQKNLLLTERGHVLIVDWDVSTTMPAECELLRAAFDLAGWQSGPPQLDVLNEVLGSYCMAGGPAGPLRLAHLGFGVLLQLDWVAVNVKRLVAEEADDERERGVAIATQAIAQLQSLVVALPEVTSRLSLAVDTDFEAALGECL